MKTIQRSIRPLFVLATAAGLGLATLSAHADPSQGFGRGQIGNTNSHAAVDGNIVDVQVRVSGANAPLFFKPGAFDRRSTRRN